MYGVKTNDIIIVDTAHPYNNSFIVLYSMFLPANGHLSLLQTKCTLTLFPQINFRHNIVIVTLYT